jgi:hypothetical protein
MAVREYQHPLVRLTSPALLNSVRPTNRELGLKLLYNRFSSGTLGPVAFGLGLRDSCLVILFFNLLCAIPPAYL